MEFKYITDEGFQEILKRGYIELKTCQEHKASKEVLLLCGSILEAVLTDYFCENLPAGKTKNNVLEGTLSNLLDYAEDEKVINKSDKQLATVLKDYRNIIHPGREIRKKEVFDHRNSELAVSVLELLLAKIESKHKEKYDVEVEDILFNLDEDWNYRSIYSQVITRLNSAQRKELFQELLDL